MSDVRAKRANSAASDKPETEARSGRRARQLKSGIIVFNERRSTIACTIRDVSDSGARLRPSGLVNLPDEFELIFINDRKIITVRKCWHSHPECGVMFTGAMRTAPPLSSSQS
jgi:hypothetical protein